MNLRVSRLALEFDLFIPDARELRPYLSALQQVGDVLSRRKLTNLPGHVDPDKVISEARTLFNEERYWEAHEVLEGLWKQTQGKERQWLQGMILTAAALV